MTRKLFLIAAAIISFCLSSAAQDFLSPSGTYLYAQRDTCDLFLDIYYPAKGSETQIGGKEKPTIIFMFGGGFITGQRDNESYNKWFRQLTENGYGVISIDYRLGLKGSNKVGIAQTNLLDKAIHMAVEDLFSATNFIIDNAAELKIDPYNMVVSGSSAGAISVIQAEYEIANQTSWAKVLPKDFNYAGVMSFAGAIFSREGKIDFKTAPCPTMMLHGTADSIVPYTQIAVLNLGFFGAGKLVDRFKKYDLNYNMYHFIDYGHEIASSMDTTLDLQIKFLENNVIQGKKRIVEAWISDPDIYKGSRLKSRKDIYGN
ncbi:MAG: alpha/beta hydrolase [Bacteroidales bacterium]|nr:alpha/beta hydrolase [Bacteroidales bacterium]